MKFTICKCGQPARKGQRYCWACHAEFMREWRKTHRLSGEALKRAYARSYLKTYVSRGKIKRGVCAVCGSPDVEGHHADYDRPLDVTWLCTRHHLELHGKRMVKENVPLGTI